MSLADLMAAARNSERPHAESDAQKQWLEKGTVSDDYARTYMNRSFANSREGMEVAVREAIERSRSVAAKK